MLRVSVLRRRNPGTSTYPCYLVQCHAQRIPLRSSELVQQSAFSWCSPHEPKRNSSWISERHCAASSCLGSPHESILVTSRRRFGGAAAFRRPLSLAPSATTPSATTVVKDADLEKKPTTVISDVDSAKRALEQIFLIHERDPTRFWACDTEAADIDVKKQSPIGHGRVIAATVYAGSDIDFGSGSRLFIDNLDNAEGTLEVFKPFFENDSILKVWHNYSFDRHILYNHGINCKGFGGDTMHLARLLDPTRSGKGAYSLEGLSEHFLNNRKRPIKERFGQKFLKDGTVAKINVMPDLEELQRNPMTRSDWIDYAASDAELTFDLRRALEIQLKNQPLFLKVPTTMYDFYERYWRPFGELLTDMERAGIFLNTNWLAQAQKEAEGDAETLWNTFRQWAAHQCPDAKFINPKSTSQLQQLLFAPLLDRDGKVILKRERVFKTENIDGFVEAGKTKPSKFRPFSISGLGLKPVSRTPKNLPSADSASLAVLAGSPDKDPPKFGRIYDDLGGGDIGLEACFALDAAVKASRIEKLLNTYLIPLQTQIDSDSRIHCSLNLNTETGRLSARRPNLQNQPSLEKDSYRIRQAFAAAPGRSLVIADYGQLELRLLAHLSNCKSMIDAFKAGGDFHSRTAIGMYDHIKTAVDNGEVLLEWDFSQGPTPKPLLKDKFGAERRQAKTLNFSIAYGKTARGLGNDWGVSVAEAEKIVQRWYSDRPEVKNWQDLQKKLAEQTGSVKTLMGRSRRVFALPVKNSERTGTRPQSSSKDMARANRLAINTPVQGSAADVVMMAMIKIWQDDRLKELGWKLLLQIHDEVILEGPSESSNEALSIVRQRMEHPFSAPLRVDLVVDAKIVQNWYEAK